MAEESKKLSYEELENAAKQMAQQIEMMRDQMKKNSFNEAVARLNFSFQVLQNEKFFPKNYVKEIVDDIQKILTIEKPEESEDSNKSKPVEKIQNDSELK